MVEEGPEIYLFDGDDEFAINQSISKITSRLGDANIAEMNTTRLDGRSFTLSQLKDAVATVPFLASKRLVILRVTLFADGKLKSSFKPVTLVHWGLPLACHPEAVDPTGMVMLFQAPMRDALENALVRSYWK